MKLIIDFDDPEFKEFLIGMLCGLAVLSIVLGLVLWLTK